MDMQEPNERADVGRYRLKKAAVFSVGLCLLIVAAAVAYGLCTLQLKNVAQDIENTQRELQQSWVDKALDAIHAWNTGLTDQLRLVSSAEIFRLFAMDVRSLGQDGLQRLTAPDAAQSPDETVVSLAEQMSYMQDLLQDFIRSKGWLTARIVTHDGLPLLAPKGDTRLSEEDVALVGEALRTKAIAYGAVRMRDNVPVLCVADPMFEVLGRGDNAPVAALLAIVPMDKALMNFLSLRQEHKDLLPAILQYGATGWEAIVLRNGVLSVESAHLENTSGSLPFKHRKALVGEGDTYSLGNRLTSLGWLVAIEAPSAMVEEQVQGQARQIYGLGILGSLGAALLLAFIWASLVSRSHRATALRFQRLYKLIRRQKMLLDSVNASLQAGLMLMDGTGQVQMCNPAFVQLTDASENDVQGADIDAVLPAEAAGKLRASMQQFDVSRSECSLEISVPRGGNMHLYRVTLFPFEERQDGQSEAAVHGGCVGIFQDITEFRRRAEVARRQKALLDSVNASLQAGLMLMDADGLVQMCNPAFGNMAERAETAIVGRHIASILPGQAANNLIAGMEQVSTGGRESSLEVSVPGAGGTRLYRVTLFPFDEKRSDQTGVSVRGGCVGIFQDITEFRRRAEVARRQKALLDSVNASLQAGLMLMDGEGCVQMCNPAFAVLAGSTEENIVGKSIDAVLPATAAGALLAGMERMDAEGNEGSLEISVPWQEETRLYRVSLFPFEEKNAAQAEDRGGCVSIFQDITEFRRRAEAARQRQVNSMAALARAIESVDTNLVGHSLKMEKVATLLAASMNLPDKDRETLRFAARLSQVGKIFVPRGLLTKKGSLTPEEQSEVNRAPEYAYNILHDMQFNLPVSEAVYQMGERMDGTGQPRHLRGEEIMPNARALAVINAYCAMVSARAYRAGMPSSQAIALLRQDSGFDQHVVDALSAIPEEDLQRAVTDAMSEEA